MPDSQARQSKVDLDDVPKSICEVLLDVLVEFGVHAKPPRLIEPPRLVVALYEAADNHYAPMRSKLVERIYTAEKRVEVTEAILHRLADAAWGVPVKQYDRLPGEQERVETFTAAVVEARDFLRERSSA